MQGKAQGHERQFKCNLYSPSFCVSPNHLLVRLEILIFIKTAPNSLIIAFASMVFQCLEVHITIPPFVDQEVSHVRRAQVSAEEESPVHTKLA